MAAVVRPEVGATAVVVGATTRGMVAAKSRRNLVSPEKENWKRKKGKRTCQK